jgi:hypothetical protein
MPIPENPKLILATCRHGEVSIVMRLLEGYESQDEAFWVFECPDCKGQVTLWNTA